MDKHTEVGYRINIQHTGGLLGKHTEYRVGYRVNTQNTGGL